MKKKVEMKDNQTASDPLLAQPAVSKRFSVNSYSIINTSGSMYMHWSEGLNMIIEKDGVVMKLNSDEIQEIVKALPRTVGGRY